MTGGTWNLGATLALANGAKSLINGVSTIPIGFTHTAQQTLAYGIGSGCMTLLVAKDPVLGPSGSATYDLFTGTDLTDVYGDTAPFRLLRSLAIWISAGGDSTGVTIGNAASNGSPLFFGANTETWKVYPSGPPLLGGSPAGVAVASTTKNLKITNNSPTAVVTVSIRLVGINVASGEAMGTLGGVYP